MIVPKRLQPRHQHQHGQHARCPEVQQKRHQRQMTAHSLRSPLRVLLLAAALLILTPLHQSAAQDPEAIKRANEQLVAVNALPATVEPPVVSLPAEENPMITIEEQLQQAEALGVALTQEQLARANPLLGTAGRLADPVRLKPADWPDG